MNVRLPKNGGMNAMLKQAQKMQEDMAALQQDLESREYEASAGGGMATVKMNGKHEVLSLQIDPELVDPDDVETLSDVIVAAFNQAIKQVDDTASEEMAKISGPLGLGGAGMPGLF